MCRFLQPVRICGGETTGVLREDLNFRGLRMLATITFLLLTFSNYQLWQLPILPPPLFVSKNLQKTYISSWRWKLLPHPEGTGKSLRLCHFPPDTLISDYETVSAASK